jgi:hypothetical protein
MTIGTSCGDVYDGIIQMSSPMVTAICVDNSQELHWHRTDGDTTMGVPSASAPTMEIQYLEGS